MTMLLVKLKLRLSFGSIGNEAISPYQSLRIAMTVELFNKKMKEQGNFCELHLFEGENHGFFNYNRKSQIPFNETMIKTKQFLRSIGFIK